MTFIWRFAVPFIFRWTQSRFKSNILFFKAATSYFTIIEPEDQDIKCHRLLDFHFSLSVNYTMKIFKRYKTFSDLIWNNTGFIQIVRFVELKGGGNFMDVKKDQSTDPSSIRSSTTAATTTHPESVNPSLQFNKPQKVHITTCTHISGHPFA